MPNLTPEPSQPLTTKRIMRFFTPLALSWLFMALEGPISAGVIGSNPDATLNMAAFLVLMSLALWIESPVIDLLSTSTTLSTSRQNYLTITRFTQHLMLWTSVVHALLVFTPLYGVVTGQILRIPQPVADATLPALQIMLPWSACIGWRRYLQGILIRHGQTRWVGAGTFVRLTAMGTSAGLLSWLSPMPSIQIVGAALIASVFSEALFAHWASLKTIATAYAEPSDEAPISMRRLCGFHFPLTLTTMVMFLSQPFVSAALARSPDAVVSMASWQTSFSIMWMMRAAVYALPEVVITLSQSADHSAALRRFSVQTGLVCSGIMALFAATGAVNLYFVYVAGAEPEVAHWAWVAFASTVAFPLIGALQSYCRGMLTLNHLTKPRLYSIFVSIVLLVVGLLAGTALRWPGIITASVAMHLAQLSELGALYAFWRLASRRIETATA